MRVVHIGFRYGLCNAGGAAIAATRLHLALLNRGIESHYICVHKLEDGPNIHVLPNGGILRWLYLALTKLSRGIWRLSKFRRPISINVVTLYGRERLLRELQPDVVHVHWINADVCTFEQLAKLPYRMVFNLHDLFWIKGPFLSPGDNGGVTALGKLLSRRRRKLIEEKRPTFVGPSEWVCSVARGSEACKGCNVIKISNLVDSAYSYREGLRHPHKKFTMLFGAFGGRGNAFKGWADCEKSLKLLPEDVRENAVLNIVGESALDYEIDGLKVHFLGVINEPESLVAIYHNSDILLFPSLQETQGMMKVEALLCGVPVVAFNRAACAESIENGVNGWVADDGNIESFAKGIVHFYSLWCCGAISNKIISDAATNEFSTPSTVENTLLAYWR